MGYGYRLAYFFHVGIDVYGKNYGYCDEVRGERGDDGFIMTKHRRFKLFAKRGKINNWISLSIKAFAGSDDWLDV